MATGPSGAYVAPPKSLSLQMHYFLSGDTELPPSLSSVLSGLGPEEYLIRGNLNYVQTLSAYVYNPGTSTYEQYYDAYNVQFGDWLANDATGYTWKVTQLFNVIDAPDLGNNTSAGVFYCVMMDVDRYNAGLDATGGFNGAPSFIDSTTILFTLNEEGFPIFTPGDTFIINPSFSGNVIGRFQALNTYEEYVSISQTNAATTFQIGDPVYIDQNTGLFATSRGIGDVSIIYDTIGIVTTIGIPNNNTFTFQPFNEYRQDLGLTGGVGTVYYVNPSGPDQYTSIKPTENPYPVYQIIDASGNAVLLTNSFGMRPGGTGPTGDIGPTGLQGPTGVGETGPTGPVVAYIFDGGDASSSYILGPAFDCGNAS